MRRLATVVSAVAVITLAAAIAALAANESSEKTGSSGKAVATKLTVWVGWSAGHELIEFKKVVAEYDKKNTAVDITVVGGINDNKISAALRSSIAGQCAPVA